MEIKKKKVTLAGLFGQYIFVFVIRTVLAAVISFAVMFFMILMPGSWFLPANYAEQQLVHTKEKLQEADSVTEEMIPSGSLYGVYDRNGKFLYGSFDAEVQKDAWEKYQKDNIYPKGKGYYFFIKKNNGDICIVKYFVALRYANERLNDILLPPETFNMFLTLGVFVILTLLNGFFLSRRFARRLKSQLACLSEATAKISANDLEFDTEASTIQEVDDVMTSLGKMKDALKHSLKQQWDAEQIRNQQLSALTHDIKTPLTVVRGNAELLTESEIREDDRECANEILKNTAFIENCLDSMRQVLRGQKERKCSEKISQKNLTEELRNQVSQLAAVCKMPVSFNIPTAGEKTQILCRKEEILRAWGNLVSNALEHTDPEKGIYVSMKERERQQGTETTTESQRENQYLVVSVRDYGAGFSEKALLYGAEPFFSGDESRHNRTHQGLGLSIADKFMKQQGGFLEFKNVEDGQGARVSLWIKEEKTVNKNV